MTTKMEFQRRSCKIKRIEQVRNDKIERRMNVSEDVLINIKRRNLYSIDTLKELMRNAEYFG